MKVNLPHLGVEQTKPGRIQIGVGRTRLPRKTISTEGPSDCIEYTTINMAKNKGKIIVYFPMERSVCRLGAIKQLVGILI